MDAERSRAEIRASARLTDDDRQHGRNYQQHRFRYCHSAVGHPPTARATVRVTFGVLPKVTLNLRALTTELRSRGSVHVQVHRLINAPAGGKSFRHLLRLMGEENTARGPELERDFRGFKSP